MLRILWVGDPHVEPHDLGDASALTKLVLDTAEQNGPLLVVLAGDLYHTHAIVHAEVQLFWYDFFRTLRERGIDALVIKGNHDAPGNESSKATALLTHVEQATVVLAPYDRKGILFCPYIGNHEELVAMTRLFPNCRTLMCHAMFRGSQYDNGFYVPDGEGVDPADIRQELIISGHVHRPQRFGKVWYPGAPRWKTLSDANQDRAIWLLDFDDTGLLTGSKPIDTGAVCRQIIHRMDMPDDMASLKHDPRHEYRVDSFGPAAWLEERKPLFAGWARWRGVKTDPKVEIRVRESEGVQVAFGKWLDAYQPKYGTDREVLRGMIKERVGGW